MPRVGNGAVCMGTPHCHGGLICVGKTLDGTCIEPVGEDGACEQASDCAAGLTCDWTSKTCVEVALSGAPCQGADQCAAGLACDPSTWTCTPPPGEGEACFMGSVQCAQPWSCFDFQKGQGLCRARVGAGEACVKDNNCVDGFGCVNDKCAAASGPGGPCLNGYLCNGGWCDHDLDDAQCQGWFEAGAPCKAGNECGPTGACILANGKLVCAPMPTLGQHCLLQCAAGLVCQREVLPGICQPALCGVGLAFAAKGP